MQEEQLKIRIDRDRDREERSNVKALV